MKISLITLLFVSGLSAKLKPDKQATQLGVLVLDKNNFEDTLKANENVLVQFCNMKIKKCKDQVPELEKAAQMLKDQNLPYQIAKIDIDKNEKFVKKHIGNNKAYKMIFYKNLNENMAFTGRDSHAAKLVHWLEKVNGDLTTQVTCEQLKEQADQNDYTLAFFGDVTSTLYKKTYEKYALTEDLIKYVHVNQEEKEKCGSEYKVDADRDGIVFFRKFDQSNYIYRELHEKPKNANTLELIKSFVNPLLLPNYFEFDEDDHKDLIFETPQNALILLGAKKDADYMKVYEEVAGEMKGKIPFTYHACPQSSFLFNQGYKWQIPATQYPVLVGYVPKGNQKKVFEIAPKDFTLENLSEFADKISNGVIDAPVQKSEPVPDNAGDVMVRKVVGGTYKRFVMEKNISSVIYLYHSEENSKNDYSDIFDDVADSLKDDPDHDIIFGKIDIALNDVQRTEIKFLKGDYPTFIIYAKEDKKNPIQWQENKKDKDGLDGEKLSNFITETLHKKKHAPPRQKRGKKEPKKNSKAELKKQNIDRAKKMFPQKDEL